jgi:hypothetical protein
MSVRSKLHADISVYFSVEIETPPLSTLAAQAAADTFALRAARVIEHADFPMVDGIWSKDRKAHATASAMLDDRNIEVFPDHFGCMICGGRVVHRPTNDPEAGERVDYGAGRVVHHRCRPPLSREERVDMLVLADGDDYRLRDPSLIRRLLHRYEEALAKLEERLAAAEARQEGPYR